jgi:hypothetical protein
MKKITKLFIIAAIIIGVSACADRDSTNNVRTVGGTTSTTVVSNTTTTTGMNAALLPGDSARARMGEGAFAASPSPSSSPHASPHVGAMGISGNTNTMGANRPSNSNAATNGVTARNNNVGTKTDNAQGSGDARNDQAGKVVKGTNTLANSQDDIGVTHNTARNSGTGSSGSSGGSSGIAAGSR